jgi:hypothetical protein
VPKVETDFNYEWFAPPDSPLKEAFQMRDTHFGGPVRHTKRGSFADNDDI